MAVIKSGVHKYLDKIAKSENEFMIAFLIKLKGRNKDLDNFINCNNDEIKCRIANVGRPQDLDILINSRNFYSIHSVLKNGRSKDIDKYMEDIDDCFYCSSIIQTGIDKYMDYIIENNFGNIHEILLVDIGRKKDLDKIIKTKNEYILSKIINNQYEEHLHLLSHHYYPDISKLAEETLTECNLKTIWKINI